MDAPCAVNLCESDDSRLQDQAHHRSCLVAYSASLGNGVLGCAGYPEAHHAPLFWAPPCTMMYYDVLGPAENYVGFCRCGRCIRFSWSKFRWETSFETIATSLLRCSKYTLSKTILPITEERERDPRLKQDKTRQRKHHQSPRSVVTSCKDTVYKKGAIGWPRFFATPVAAKGVFWWSGSAKNLSSLKKASHSFKTPDTYIYIPDL